MKIIGLIILGIVVYFFIVGFTSKAKASVGLVSGKLAECSTKPNCVCSEYDEKDDHYISPLKQTDTMSIETAKQVILDMNGVIINEQENYLAGTFTSRIFRFVDDFEVRLDPENNVFHIRSASRVGHSDFGVNRKRVDAFKVAMEKQR